VRLIWLLVRAPTVVSHWLSASPYDVSLLLGRGDGTFQTELPFATGSYPNAVAVADLDGDGLPDLAVANSGSRSVSVLLTKCGP
jgi:hypothetical protein